MPVCFQNMKHFIPENATGNFVCEMSVILAKVDELNDVTLLAKYLSTQSQIPLAPFTNMV